ncbi:MAG TPA: hypothetical protein VF784_17820 [Anaerolineales bacterium]
MKRLALVCASLGVGVLLAACAAVTPSAATATPQPSATSSPVSTLTPTPDLCSPALLPQSVSLVNFYVKRFEPYTSLASYAPQSQYPALISAMQDIRDATQRQVVPPCLIELKHDALLWMNTSIQALSTIQSQPGCMAGAPMAQKEACGTAIAAGSIQARNYNDTYAAELARLAGITPAAPSATAAAPALTSTPLVVMVINPGPNPLNLRAFPFLTSQAVGSLAANAAAIALGKTTNGEWLLVEIPGKPGQHAWLYASLVEFTSGKAGDLPVVAH